jgi:drug/metabolite transporter (DMT)-like permease
MASDEIRQVARAAARRIDAGLIPNDREDLRMSMSGLLQLGLSTLVFLAAATMAKQWALAPGMGKLIATLALYTLGNLIMLRLVREFGMASAFSLSAVIQLVAVNLIALVYFGEKLAPIQSLGIVLAIVAVGLITLGPQLTNR